MSTEFQVEGENHNALFTLKLHRGDGMALVAMNWKDGKPPDDFVGFAIEYREPDGDRFYPLKNRLAFPGPDETVNPNRMSTRLSPIQKFRWVHFPRNAELTGKFVYHVVPVFMNRFGELSYGELQEAAIELRRETYPGQLNVAFTRGFVSSQAFVDRYGGDDAVQTLLPPNADAGLTFTQTHPRAENARDWMGFEARLVILDLLDRAVADPTAQVRVVAYDLNQPELVSRLESLGRRLKVIIDDSDSHGEEGSAEGQAEERLVATAGRENVKRQHMGGLQHNKTIVVDGDAVKAAVCGSTNFSWRGFFVQSNNAVVLSGEAAVEAFLRAFDAYWENDGVSGFGKTSSARFADLGMPGIDVSVGFSPYATQNAQLATIAGDIGDHTTSSLFFSLAFLYQTPGAILDAIEKVTQNPNLFVYGISDRKVGGIDVQMPTGNVATVSPAALRENAPEPFKSEPVGGGGNRMHHKFVVIDFDQPTARVYLGSYNFSKAADGKNGENLLRIRDRRVAVSYVVEALRIFDHYHFRLLQQEEDTAQKKLVLARPPASPEEKPWWDKDYTDPRRVLDRELFA